MNIITTQETPNGRGCGTRTEGTPYACCGFSEEGTPIEFFVVDPARGWPGKFQRGVKILPRNPKDPASVNDLMIFVGGKEFYQSPWSFVEEVRRFGASRKMPHNLPFDKLTHGESRMIFVHGKVIPQFWYEADRDKPYYGCPHFFDESRKFSKELWDSVAPGLHPDRSPCTHALRDLAFLVHGDIEPVANDHMSDDGKYYQVNMPSFSYEAKYPLKPEACEKTIWQTGIFMALPLTHIEYCKSADDKSKNAAKDAGFDTVVLDH